MSINELSACIRIAACICAKDGIISEIEEQAMFRVLMEQFPDFSAEDFESALTEFFDSNQQIEEYLALVDDESLRRFTLDLAELSASADGLDIKENIALEKAYLIWGMKNNV